MTTMITAQEAARVLGVKITTVYAYASRGWLHSVRAPDDPRKRLYARSEVERLKRRGDAHRGDDARASSALHWGAPVLETHISQITRAGPKYRGHLARGLARHRFEDVAELLWTGDLEEGARWPGAPPVEVPEGLSGIDRIRVATTMLGVLDPERFTPARALPCARRAITAAVTIISGVDHDPKSSLAERLAQGWGVTEVGAIEAALIMLADHELNASTFAARVAASTGADLYACLAAALATFTGPRHGGSATRAESLVRDALSSGDALGTLADWAQRPGPLPGFHHPLYDHGDPRVPVVLESLEAPVFAQLQEAAERMGVGRPNIDLGLGVLSASLELRPGSAAVLFGIGRMAGWVAHALEQRERKGLLRPRARYVES